MKIKTISIVDAAPGDTLLMNINHSLCLIRVVKNFSTMKSIICKIYLGQESELKGEEVWSEDKTLNVEALGNQGITKFVDDANLSVEEVREVAHQNKPWFDNRSIIVSGKQSELVNKTSTNDKAN